MIPDILPIDPTYVLFVGEFATIATAFSIIGTVVSAVQSFVGASQAQATANQQAQQAIDIREQERLDFLRRTEALKGTQIALLGPQGVTVSGTPLLVAEDIAAEAALQAERIRHAGLTEANRIRQQAAIDFNKGVSSSIGGFTRAGASLVGGLGDVSFGTPSAPSRGPILKPRFSQR